MKARRNVGFMNCLLLKLDEFITDIVVAIILVVLASSMDTKKEKVKCNDRD